MEFDFDFDLDMTDWQKPTVNGLALFALKKDRVTVSINKGTEQLAFLVGEFDSTKIYTLLSVRGGVPREKVAKSRRGIGQDKIDSI